MCLIIFEEKAENIGSIPFEPEPGSGSFAEILGHNIPIFAYKCLNTLKTFPRFVLYSMENPENNFATLSRICIPCYRSSLVAMILPTRHRSTLDSGR